MDAAVFPETFSATELRVSLKACQAAIAAWNAGPGRPIIINLPTTVENATPNVFADQIEWMDRHLSPREHIVLSVHPTTTGAPAWPPPSWP